MKVGKKGFGKKSQIHKRQEEEWRYLTATAWGARGKIHTKVVPLKNRFERRTWGGKIEGKQFLQLIIRKSPSLVFF